MDSKVRGQADADCLFLEHVLDKLYDFGGAEAGQSFRSQRQRKRRRADEPELEDPSEDPEDPSEDPEDPSEGPEDPSGSRDVRADPRRKSEEAGSRSQNQVEVVVFQDPRKKRRRKEGPAPPTVSKAEETQREQMEELNLEKARLEVHRFGITGFKKEEQRVFEQDRAVMLGARPPRREHVNYKLLQQRVRQRKEEEKGAAQPDLKKKKKQKTEKDRRTSTSGPGAAPTGQMGRFKNGMLILSSSEIQKIKGRK